MQRNIVKNSIHELKWNTKYIQKIQKNEERKTKK